MIRSMIRGLVALAFVPGVIGCESAPDDRVEPAATADDSKLVVYAVNYPLKYFAERIAGDLAQVEFPAPSDIDPAYWFPTTEAILDYQKADLVLLNGANYARWIETVSLAQSKLVLTSESFVDRYITVEGALTHTHGPGGEHSDSELAFTTWLDPTLAIEQARAIAEAFSSARPQHENAFTEGFESLERDLIDLDGSIERAVSDLGDEPLLASHPVYQYLAQRYSLSLESVHFEPDESPSPRDWRELEMLISGHPAKWMLWERRPSDEIAARLRQLGVESVVFNPAGNAPGEGDYLSVMRQNVENLEMVFTGSPRSSG